MRPAVDQSVFVDFETLVAPGYDLSRMSVRRYVGDPRFRVLSVAVAVGALPVTFYYRGASRSADGLDAAYERLVCERDAGKQLVAHNVLFEGTILEKCVGVQFVRLFDTAAYGRYLGLGSSLKAMARYFGQEKREAPTFDESSLQEAALLRKMALYNMSDVALARLIYREAVADPSLPEVEFDVIDHTARINMRGVRVGQEQVAAALKTLCARRDAELGAFARRYGFDTTHLNRGKRVQAFLHERFGVRMTSLDRRDDAFVDAVARGGEAAEFLLARARLQALARVIKRVTAYASIDGGRVHGFLKYYGAHTGRFSAGGRDAEKLNIHGLSKGDEHLQLPELAIERTVVVPEGGMLLRACDLASIEARVVAWLAVEEALLERFRDPEDDVYSWFANLVFPGIDIKKKGPNAHLRALGKTSVLGLGFGMGLATFRQRVLAERIGCSAQDVERAFATYQASFPWVKELRRRYFEAFRKAASGWRDEYAHCVFRCQEDGPAAPTVIVELPTGRCLYYRSVRITNEMSDWGVRPAIWFAPSFGGKGRSPVASQRRRQRVFEDGVVRHQLTPQVVVENIVQAAARDLMVHQALELERQGLPVAWHAHDEVVCLCPRCGCTRTCTPGCPWTMAGDVLAEVMGRVPATLPGLAGLPLAVALNNAVRETYAP